ncbi:MAG: hypothetical protein WCJ09_11200 [Planctomycetota bacterium]
MASAFICVIHAAAAEGRDKKSPNRPDTALVAAPASKRTQGTESPKPLSSAKSTIAKSVTGDPSSPRILRTALPQIRRSFGGQSSNAFGGTWFQFTDVYSGSAPTSGANPVVIPAVQFQGVYLGATFATTNASMRTTLESYLQFLSTSTFLSELSAPYGTSTGTALTGKVINVSLPQYSVNSVLVTDLQIVDYLATNINSALLTSPTSSTVYVVYVEPGVAIDDGSGATSINSFLGYHSSADITVTGGATKTVYYAVIPYPGSPNPTPLSQNFDNVTDELTAVTSHEIAEAVTDPDLTTGWQETVRETFTLKLFGWTLFHLSLNYPGEEIGDVPLLLNNYSKDCYARYSNGYLIQRVIGADGVTLLTPSGATPLAASSTMSSRSTVRHK